MKSKCPICKKETVIKFRPFCSLRCKDIDLLRWLKGDYFIPGDEDEAKNENPDNDDND